MDGTRKSKLSNGRRIIKATATQSSRDQREDASEASSSATAPNTESSAVSQGPLESSSVQQLGRSVSPTKATAKPGQKAHKFFASKRRPSQLTAPSATTKARRKSTASTRSGHSRRHGSVAGNSEELHVLKGVPEREEHSTKRSRRGDHDSRYSHDMSAEKERVRRRISTHIASAKPLDITSTRAPRVHRERASYATDRDSALKSVRRDWSDPESSSARDRPRGSTTTLEPMRELPKTPVKWSTSRLVRRQNIVTQNEPGARQERAIDIAVGTLLLVLVLVFVGLLYALFTRQKNATVVSCTGECLDAQRYLERLINVKHNACGDFYERVCSSWSYTDDSGFIADMVKETERRLNSSLLEVSSKTVESEQVLRAGAIYRSCYTYTTSVVHQEPALLTADKILKFSSLRKSENWNELLQSLVRFAFQAGVYTVFSMDFVGDKGRPVLHIAAGRSIKQKRFGTASSKKFEDIMHQLLGVPIEIITVIDQHVDDALKSSDSGEKQGSLESFVSGAIQGLSAVDWIIAVNKVVPKFSRIRLIDTVVTIGIDQVKAALNVLTEAGFKDAIEYHVASMAANAVMFDVFQNDSEPSAEKAASFCLLVTKTLLRYSWPHVATNVLATTKRHQILRDVFSIVKEALSSSQVLYWTSDSAYTKAAKEGRPNVATHAAWPVASAKGAKDIWLKPAMLLGTAESARL
ncbi:hypothetical protein MTO96_005537 [Rhipicephalus appendiculatus]